MRQWLIWITLLLLSTSGTAQDRWAGYGMGAQGCGKYVENRRTPNRTYDNYIGQWFFGFVTAFNYYGPNPQVTREIEQDTVLAYLDKYCRENPMAGTSAGALELIKTFVK